MYIYIYIYICLNVCLNSPHVSVCVFVIRYDHENDQDWMNMTKKEDEVIDEMVKLFPSIRDKRK
jgi:hypothetical protein